MMGLRGLFHVPSLTDREWLLGSITCVGPSEDPMGLGDTMLGFDDLEDPDLQDALRDAVHGLDHEDVLHVSVVNINPAKFVVLGPLNLDGPGRIHEPFQVPLFGDPAPTSRDLRRTELEGPLSSVEPAVRDAAFRLSNAL